MINLNRRLRHWLEQMGFREEPFALYEADREQSFLPYFFVDRPYVAEIIGDPSKPRTTFLFAKRGAGKTATREIVAYECQHARLRYKALPVQLTDFSSLISSAHGDIHQITARHFVSSILRAAVKSLVDNIPPLHFDQLDKFQREVLLGFGREFADPITELRLREYIVGEPMLLRWDMLSETELLSNFVSTVLKVGRSADHTLQAVYVLVDRVDETPGGRAAAVPLLTPLIEQPALLELPNLAFKFFLDEQIGENAVQAAAVRPDRLAMRWIDWSESSLTTMVDQRIAYFSEGRWEHFEQLCNSSCRNTALNRLIAAADGSPRTLLRICHTLFQVHVERTYDRASEYQFDRADISQTLDKFEYIIEQESRLSALPTRTVAGALNAPIEPGNGVFIDSGGHVYIDGALLEQALSEKEYRLLHALYKAAPQIVSQDQLIREVWPPEENEGIQSMLPEADEQNLRKLVTRLRRRLPGGEDERFIHNARGRGYWLQIR